MVAETTSINRLNNGSALNAAIAEESEKQRAAAMAGADGQPLFTAAELEQLAFRRFNPYATLTAVSLSAALDAYEAGEIMSAARIWARIAKSDPTINTVKPKREEAVALRPISTRAKDDSPLAHDQAAFLKNFYANATATHATKRHAVGKSSLLLKQMMESRAYEYAAHHIIWQPNAAQLVTLPSGKQLPSLTAKFEYVPLEFFEARTGELRFLGLNNFYNGQPLSEFGDWMITYGPGLMFCACILHWFKRLFRHDGVNFSEKFGQPGTLVHTTAQKNSEEGKAALELAQKLASNYRGVIYGAQENKAEYIWPSGGVSAEGLVMHVLGLDIKQELTSMWMGADLSTMSRGNKGEQPIGASVQGKSEDNKEQLDCKEMGDTLNVAVDPLVLQWGFGRNTPILAEAFVEYPETEDRRELRESVTFAVNAGVQVPQEPVLKRLNVPIAKEGEEVFEKADPPPIPGAEVGPARNASRSDAGGGQRPEVGGPQGRRGDKKTATNVDLSPDEDMARFLGRMAPKYFQAFHDNMQPLHTALSAVLSEDDIDFKSKVAWLQSQMGSLATEIFAAPKEVGPLAEIIRRSIEHGWKKAALERSTAEIASTVK